MVASSACGPGPVSVYAYGSYVDEVLCYTTGQGAQQQRYYPHYNHPYSVAALTGDKLPNGNVPVVERYSYDAYGKQTITGPSGGVRSRSSVGWDRTFTGYIADNESGLLHARSRQYSPTLGWFISRDSLSAADLPSPLDGYQSGFGLYVAFFVPNSLDPSGFIEVTIPIPPENLPGRNPNRLPGFDVTMKWTPKCPTGSATIDYLEASDPGPIGGEFNRNGPGGRNIRKSKVKGSWAVQDYTYTVTVQRMWEACTDSKGKPGAKAIYSYIAKSRATISIKGTWTRDVRDLGDGSWSSVSSELREERTPVRGGSRSAGLTSECDCDCTKKPDTSWTDIVTGNGVVGAAG